MEKEEGKWGAYAMNREGLMTPPKSYQFVSKWKSGDSIFIKLDYCVFFLKETNCEIQYPPFNKTTVNKIDRFIRQLRVGPDLFPTINKPLARMVS